jgi:neutral ceramidase
MSYLLLAGADKLCITPPLGTRMAGYRARREGAAFVHDDLFARALVLESAGARFGLVSLDVMAVEDEWVAELRRRAEETLGIPPSNLLVAATHTHSAQGGLFRSAGAVGGAFDTMMGDGAAPYDEVIAEVLLRQTLTVVRTASEALRPAGLALAQTQAVGIAANRLDESRPADDRCTVLVAEADDGEPLATVFHFNCHPTVLGEGDLGLSGDFPGTASRIVEGATGGVALFLNGALGDVSTRFTRREQSYAEVRRFGRILGGAVLGALGNAVPLEEPSVDAREVVVELPPRPEEWNDRIATRVAELSAAKSHGERRQLLTAKEGLESAVRAGATIAQLPSVPLRVQRLAFGPELTLLGVPGEPFTSFAELVREHAGEATRVVAPANGYPGYLPDREAYDAGGYEVGCSLLDRGAAEELARAGAELAGGAVRA